MDKKKGLILSVLGIISLIAITIGVTYAFFSYTKEGTTENTLTTGTITFLYTEIDKIGAGIEISDALPIPDSQGKLLSGSRDRFNFKVTSDTTNSTAIFYEITARKKADSTLDEKAVRIYLTEILGINNEVELLLDNFDKLTDVTKYGNSEKLLYSGRIPSGQKNYTKEFNLRMWIDEKADFSPVKDENGQDIYPYNNKAFTVTVNVYANGTVITEEDLSTEINSIKVGEIEFEEVENEEYKYEATLPEGTTEATVEIETKSPYTKVEIEKVSSLESISNDKKYSVKKLSTLKTLELEDGINLFQVTLIPEQGNKEVYGMKIMVEKPLPKLSDVIFEKYPKQSIKNNATLNKTSKATNQNGLYVSTATNNGNPTYYFRGVVDNNWVKFAGLNWRIVRINEDETIRLIMQTGIDNNKSYQFHPNDDVSARTHLFSKSNVENGAMKRLNDWYNTAINKAVDGNNAIKYSDVVTQGTYCEESKASAFSEFDIYCYDSSMVYYSKYTANYKCKSQRIVKNNIGLLSYDEVVHSGAYYSPYDPSETSYYLNNGSSNFSWTMSPAATANFTDTRVWMFSNTRLSSMDVDYEYGPYLRPVLNLKADTLVKADGMGTKSQPWEVVVR